MFPRRWYGAVLSAVLLFGSVYGPRPDAAAAEPPTGSNVTDAGWQPCGAPLGTVTDATTPVLQKVGFLPEPAPVPSQVEATAAKSRPTTATATAPAPMSSLSLEIVGPASVQVGQPIIYEMIVRNTGTAAVSKVRVQDILFIGARLLQSEPPAEMQEEHLAWSLGNLEARTERRIWVKVQPNETGDSGSCPTVSFTAAAGLRSGVARPPLTLTQSVPETAMRGQVVPFQIRITNNTNEPIQHVVLRAQIPAGLQFLQGNVVEAEVGTLATGETKSLRLEAQAVQTGRAVNEITARAAGGLSARSEASVLIQEPGLQVRVEGTRPATVGSDLELRIEVANISARPARGVGLLLTLPEGIEPLSTNKDGTIDPTNRHIVGWTLGTLNNGERQTLLLKAKARVAGDWIYQMTARAEGLADAKTTGTLHLEAAPALWLEIVGQNDAIDIGGETVYEMRVLNQGGVPCPGVKVVVQIPDGVQVVHAEGPTAAVIQPQQVLFEPLAELPGRTEALYRLQVRGQRVGDWHLRVQAVSEVLPKPLAQEASLRVNANWREVAKPPVAVPTFRPAQ